MSLLKKFGWDLAQRDVVCLETGFITKKDFLYHYGFEILDDLKRLVESYELVESYGGIDQSKQAIIDGNNHCMFIDLEKAIIDMESCQ